MDDSSTRPGHLEPPPAAPAPDPLLERLRTATLGEYDIFGELGRGGMATVYLAHEISLDRKVAIKVMAPALTIGHGMTERFKREARTAAHLSHPNIIPIYAVREAGGLLFFVMKLVEGTPLDSIMRELKKLPIPMVEAILAQVGGALGYAHRKGVVHRDIKPSNILIDDEGWAVVTDFGIAKVQESEVLTQTGTAVGTPTYMSPEHCGVGSLDGRSDQYSLGVVAYEMLTGQPPFPGSMMALMYAHCHEAVPPISTLRPDCPPGLAATVLRMLEKDPAARWPSMEEAVSAIGPQQLAPDDLTRSHLIMLARSGVGHKIVSQVQTPRSPIPLAWPTTAPTPLLERRVLGLPPIAWMIGVPSVIGAIVVLVLLFQRPATPVTPLTTLPRPDSAVPAPVAPLPPPPAPVTSALPGNNPPPRAEPPAGTSRGAGRLSTDRRIPAGAAPASPRDTVAKALATPPPSPTPLPAPPPPQPAATPTPVPVQPPPRADSTPARPVDDKALVVAAIEGYARALEAGDLNQARRIFPEMPPDQRQGLEAFWKAGGTMRTSWTVSDIVVEGGTATARVQGSNSVRTRDGISQQRVSLRARLERRGTEWRLVALVN